MKEKKIKTLICDNTAQKGIRLAAQLRAKGIYAYTRNNSAAAIMSSIIADRPDVVITELSLNETDIFSLIDNLNFFGENYPKFIILSDVTNSFIERQIAESKAFCILEDPADVGELYRIIMTLTDDGPDVDESNMELLITDMIRGLGMPPHIKGYKYVRSAIMECLFNGTRITGMTKSLYPRIAEIHHTTASGVERAIRHAIDLAWSRSNDRAIIDFLGYGTGGSVNKPTNSEFIATAVDRLSLRMKKNKLDEAENEEKQTVSL